MSTTHRFKDRGADGRIRRKYKMGYGVSFPGGAPRWWRKIYFTRPRRRQNKRLCQIVSRIQDTDSLVFPLGSSKPHEYYW